MNLKYTCERPLAGPLANGKTIQLRAVVLLIGILLISCADVFAKVTLPEASRNFVPKKVYAVSYDKIWEGALSVLDNKRITALSADKASGIIQTDVIEGPRLNIILVVQDSRYKYNLTLRSQSDGNVKLNIVCKLESTTSGGEGSTQWSDISSQHPNTTKRLEDWLYEEIEKVIKADTLPEPAPPTTAADVIEAVSSSKPEKSNATLPSQEALSNDSIIKLVKAEMPEEVIVSMVKTQPTKFEVGLDAVLALKSNGVSSTIINAMVLRGQGAIVTPTAKPSQTIKIPSKTPVRLLVSQTLSSGTAKSGEIVELIVAEDVVVNNRVVIAKDAPEAVPEILPCLTAANTHVIRDACRTLAVLANKNVIPNIEPLLNDKRSDVRKDAQKAIEALKNK